MANMLFNGVRSTLPEFEVYKNKSKFGWVGDCRSTHPGSPASAPNGQGVNIPPGVSVKFNGGVLRHFRQNGIDTPVAFEGPKAKVMEELKNLGYSLKPREKRTEQDLEGRTRFAGNWVGDLEKHGYEEFTPEGGKELYVRCVVYGVQRVLEDVTEAMGTAVKSMENGVGDGAALVEANSKVKKATAENESLAARNRELEKQLAEARAQLHSGKDK